MSRTSKNNETPSEVIIRPSIDLENEDAHIGVRKVEATHKVHTKYSKWLLFFR